MNTLQLLLLEDEPNDAELILRFLRRSGMECNGVIASDRQEYMDALAQGGFDAILADNSLPQFNSVEALNFLLEQGCDIPFILVTGTVSEEFAVHIIHMGADDYILKSNLTRLPASISAAIEKRNFKREKELAEEALRKSEAQYRQLFAMNPLAAWVVDDQTNSFLAVNNAAVRQYGYAPEEFQGLSIRDIQPSGDADSGIAKHSKKDGSTIDAEIVSTEVSYENRSAHLILINDLTQKLRAEAEIRQMNRELRELSSHLQNIREEERIQIARDIHDELGQQVTVLKMEFHLLLKKMTLVDGAIRERCETINDLIDQVGKSVKKIAANLRPAVLDDFGLVAALKWQAEEVESRFGIKVLFESSHAKAEVPAGISTGLFRIYQEALTNAVRHANAGTIRSSLSVCDGHVVLEISDDGKGMDLKVGPKKKSFGLVGIKERVFIMNGNYELRSEPGKGTSLHVSVPL